MEGGCAVVAGASGGIGAALVEALLEDGSFPAVVALSRRAGGGTGDGRLRCLPMDVTDEASIVRAAEALPLPPRLVIVATGVLHGGGLRPEKSLRALDGAAMLESYRVNAVGPALVAKHFLPLMRAPGRGVFAALSARVGSIGDNRAGGWHAYRASKAALNMVIRNLAIEVGRRTPELLCVGLHPGTVDTALSKPFQANVPPAGLFTPGQAARRLLLVIDGLGPGDSGTVLAWDGKAVPP